MTQAYTLQPELSRGGVGYVCKPHIGPTCSEYIRANKVNMAGDNHEVNSLMENVCVRSLKAKILMPHFAGAN